MIDLSSLEKHRKYIAWAVLAFVILLSFGIVARAQRKVGKMAEASLEVAIQEIKASVVQIGFRVNGVSKIAGSGFFVNEDGYVLTASHVADVYEAVMNSQAAEKVVYVAIPWPDPKEQGVQGITVYQSFHQIPFTVAARDRVHDVALLKLTKNPFSKEQVPVLLRNETGDYRLRPGFVRIRKQNLRAGENVAFAGFPLEQNFLIAQDGIVSNPVIVLPEEALRSLGLEIVWGETPEFIAIGAMINDRQSGSLLFDFKGTVVGICEGHMNAPAVPETNTPGPIRTYTTNAGIGLVVPIRYATALMDKNGIRWHTSEATEDKLREKRKVR
ncbi:MAG: trypsin-like peptidase domain-containing protein [Candidatus Koribacter versatilis]|nr:trypsin-like peptidase domain-containing protein [Candidatus Koribacter versatilis]